MSLIDWSIVFGLVITLIIAALFTQKYMRSVADFLAANRCAGRYLVTVAGGMAGTIGAISIVAGFEMHYNAGFTAAWWQMITIVVTSFISLSGWFYYRFRETRAMTLAQFLEIRYSRKFRIFMGFVGWMAGVINFGIFPAVGARFFICICGLPNTFLVYTLVMGILLVLALMFTFLGGQIAVIITDFIQGTFSSIVFLVVIVYLLNVISWSDITTTLAMAPADQSMVHPIHTKDLADFNIWYFLIMSFTILYTTGVWQGAQGYSACALSAHEARMGIVLGTWRFLSFFLFMMIVPICAYVIMNNPHFASKAQKVTEILNGIGNPQIKKQIMTPLVMNIFLPKGIIGGFAAAVLAAFLSNHDTYLHSWGSIFIQDFILPFRKKPFTPQQHIRYLRYSVFGVAVFIFCFSMIFKQTEYIFMFFLITGAIFTGGAGAAVLGGLYWKRGTIAAAWSAMITGSVLSVTAITIKQIHSIHPFSGKIVSYIASRNGAVLAFSASFIAITVYVLVSLIGRKTVFNMDKMLNRGEYSLNKDNRLRKFKLSNWESLVGISNLFSFRDKIVYLTTLGWTVIWVIIFMCGTIYNICFDVKTKSWEIFWYYYVWITVILSCVVTIWLFIGSLKDLKCMFKALATPKRNIFDDGTVFKQNDEQNEKTSFTNTASKSNLNSIRNEAGSIKSHKQ